MYIYISTTNVIISCFWFASFSHHIYCFNFAKYCSTLVFHRCSLDAFYINKLVYCSMFLDPKEHIYPVPTLYRAGDHLSVLRLIHWVRDIIDVIWQKRFPNAFSIKKKSLKLVPMGRIKNIPALVLIMAWQRPGDKPLSEPMVVSLLTHIHASLDLNELRVTSDSKRAQ